MIRGGRTNEMINEIVRVLENNPNSKIIVATHDSESTAFYFHTILRRMKWNRNLRNSLGPLRRGEITVAEQGFVKILTVGRRDSGMLRGFAPDHVFVDRMCPDWVYEAVTPYWPWATSKYDDPDW